jgi:prepilin-type N-terminal cleavage/methylation domain-containing protein
MTTRNQDGFTLVELVITLAIFGILVLIGIGLSSNTLGRNQTGNVTQDVVTTLRRAQWQSMNGHEDIEWGVHFETDLFVLFKAPTYSVSDPDNVLTNLPNDVEITSITLTGGGSDVIFIDKFGSTIEDGSIVIENINSNELRTVTVNAAGMIDWN